MKQEAEKNDPKSASSCFCSCCRLVGHGFSRDISISPQKKILPLGGFLAEPCAFTVPRNRIISLVIREPPVRSSSSSPLYFFRPATLPPCASLDFEVRWTRESPENGLETTRALEIGPAYRESERTCCRQSKQMSLATNHHTHHSLAPRRNTAEGTVFLIHGSAIKSHAK